MERHWVPGCSRGQGWAGGHRPGLCAPPTGTHPASWAGPRCPLPQGPTEKAPAGGQIWQPVEPVLREEALAVVSFGEARGHGTRDSRKRRRNTTDREDVDWDEGRCGFVTNHVLERGSSLRSSQG